MNSGEFNNIIQYRFPGTGAPSPTTQRIDYNGGNEPIYMGIARRGIEETEAGWIIEKYEYNASGNLISSKCSPINSRWDQRASLDYR